MKSLILLPFYFKIIGIVSLILILGIYILIYLLNINFENEMQLYFNQLMFSISCMALFFLNFYKRKNEDDSWILKRLHCLFFSVFLGINFYILNSFLNVISDGGFYNLGAEIIFYILLFNLVQMIGLNKKLKIKD